MVISHSLAAKGVVDSHPLKRKGAEASSAEAKPAKPKPNLGSGPRPKPDPDPNPRPKPRLKSLFQPLSRPARPGGDNQRSDPAKKQRGDNQRTEPAKKQRTAAEPGGDNQRTERATAAALAKGGRAGKGGITSGRGAPASVDAKVPPDAKP